MDAIQLKTAPPIREPTPGTRIKFLHPGYDPKDQPIMFFLAVVDQSKHDPAKWGILHETALAACRIVAANRSGRLTTDRAGIHVVETPMDGLLTEGNYYYAVDDTPTSTKYPVVPSFRDWEFPAEGPPAAWAVGHSGTTQGTNSCQLTNQIFPERAHLVPRFESAWLAHSPLASLPDVTPNLVALRGDLHSLFDRKMFAFVPKRSSPTQGYSFVAHILDNDASGYHTTLHNYTVQQVNKEAGQYMYARFAWAILFRTKPFLIAGPARTVAVRNPEDGYTVKTMSGEALQQVYGGGTHDATPLKRTWARRTGDLCDEEDYDEDVQRYVLDAYDDVISQTVGADAEDGEDREDAGISETGEG